MVFATRADRDPPGIAFEPGVRFGRLADSDTAGGFAETADAESVARGVAARVFVSAVHRDTFVLVGNGVAAEGAEQPFLSSCFVYGMDVRLLLAARCAAPVEEQCLRKCQLHRRKHSPAAAAQSAAIGSRASAQDRMGRVTAGSTHDPAARVRTRAALEEPVYRRPVARPCQGGPKEKHLLERKLALKDVSLRE